jgi:hypothetical protein
MSLLDLIGLNRIFKAGTPVDPTRKILNFIGDVTVVDNPGSLRTDITIGAGGGGGGGGATSSDDVSNESAAAGATVTDALTGLDSRADTTASTLTAYDGRLDALEAAPGGTSLAVVVDHVGTTYTVLAADVNKYRRLTATSSKTITVGPASGEALPADYEQHFDVWGAGAATFVAGSGVSILPPSGGSLVVPQNGVVTLKRVAVNAFRLLGQTVSV